MKPRHVPERTCVVCREKKSKSELTRVVRTPEGEVVVDPTGRLNGRGAYICSNPVDWVEAVAKGKLAHALKVTLSPENREQLLAHASSVTSNVSESTK